MSYALQACILIQLEALDGREASVEDIAKHLGIDAGLVRDELETLWAFGQVTTVREGLPGEQGVIVGAALAPKQEATACA